MKNVFDKIYEIDKMPLCSKHQQLVQKIINAMDEKSIVHDCAYKV